MKTTKVILGLAFLYVAVAWEAFQWRNPKANGRVFFTNFSEVITWKKIPNFQ